MAFLGVFEFDGNLSWGMGDERKIVYMQSAVFLLVKKRKDGILIHNQGVNKICWYLKR